MFRLGKKKSVNVLKGTLKIVNRRKSKAKDEGRRRDVDDNNSYPDGNNNDDSDYEDSRYFASSSQEMEGDNDNEDDETDQNQGNPNSSGSGSDDCTSTSAYEAEEPPAPVVPVVPAVLTEAERKARARKAVEERKRKSRLQIAARRDRAEGKTAPPIAASNERRSDPDQEVPLGGEPREEVRRRALSQERFRLLELQRREEEEAIKKEEAEMKELEEALKKEEEEARKLAEHLDTIKVETVLSDELRAEEEAAYLQQAESEKLIAESEKLVAEQMKKFDALETVEENENEAENARLEAEFQELEKRELEAERVRVEELAALETVEENQNEAEDARLEAEFQELEKRELEAERVRVEELAALEAERVRVEELAALEAELEAKAQNFKAEGDESLQEEERKKAEEDALLALDQFVTQEETVDFVGDVNHDESAQLPDLDDLLDDSLNESSILDDSNDGPIAFTEPTSQSVKQTKKVAPKPKIPSRPVSKRWQKRPEPKPLKLLPPRVGSKLIKKPSGPKPTRVGNKPTKKSPVLKPKPRKPVPPRVDNKPNEKPQATKAPNPVTRRISNISHLRASKAPGSSTRRPSHLADSPSFDSTGSQCSFHSIPRSPFKPYLLEMPICNAPYTVRLHAKQLGCQVCIFKLTEAEKDRYETNGRHLRVATTNGGCRDCEIFPSEEGEDPVRLCKQCFFDTHLLRAKEEEAFEGSGALTGVQRNHTTYSPNRHRFIGRR